MRKIIIFFLGMLLAIFATSCKKSGKETVVPESSEIVEQSVYESENNTIDYDWTRMNYNMLSSLIFDVQVNPEKYVGKRIKISGNFYSSIYEGTQYFSVLSWDPTGCCPAGLDFTPPQNMKYPEDFPEQDTYINVIGVIQLINIDGDEYLTYNAEKIIF